MRKSHNTKHARHQYLLELSETLRQRREHAKRDALHLTARYSTQGLALREIPGLRRAIGLARRATDVLGLIELELADA